MAAPQLTLHHVPISHPCRAVVKALELKGLDYEGVEYVAGFQHEPVAEVFGPERQTVPGLLVGEEKVHGTRAIFDRLEEIEPEPALFPDAIAEQVSEAERWGDGELQDLGRLLPWGAMHFRPEYLGTYGGGGPLDPQGTDFAIKLVRGTWRYFDLGAEKLSQSLARLPALLDHVDELASAGVVGGESPNAADLQIGATLRILLTIGDIAPLIDARPAGEIARRWFPDHAGEVPAGALPSGWVPAA